MADETENKVLGAIQHAQREVKGGGEQEEREKNTVKHSYVMYPRVSWLEQI